MNKIRVAMWGFGAMGSGMVRLMLQKSGLEVVGVIDQRKEVVGKDIGDVLELGRKTGMSAKSPSDIFPRVLPVGPFAIQSLYVLEIV